MSSPSPSELPEQWTIGLASWVLQDGNYTEFEVGQRRQFALEFHYNRVRRLVAIEEPAGRRCRYTGSVTDYDVTAHLQLDAGPQRERLGLLHGQVTGWVTQPE